MSKTVPVPVEPEEGDNTELLSLSDLKVLVAEDNFVNQAVMKGFLGPRVKTLDVAADGAEALEATQRKDYDVIMMDLRMPGTDGMTATREIRKLPTEKHDIYIIAVTAEVYDGIIDEVKQAGLDDYVAKPVSLDTLVSALEHGMERNLKHTEDK